MKSKRILAIVCVLALLCSMMLTLGSCSTEKDKYVVGISQLVTHDALDSATEGFKQALIDKLGEDKVEFNFQNAANQNDVCITIANSFVSSKVDLIMANGTTALQAAANATVDIPILGTSITEYGVALNIDNFSGTVGGNISGTSDLAPLDEQAQMVIDLVPEAKKVGLLYCSSEPNSAYQVSEVRKYLESKNIECVDYKFSDSNDVTLITTQAVNECDAIYIPTDNTAASCAETINGVALPAKKPIIAGEAGICSGCGIATLSISYYNLGYKTGEMAAKILTGEADISEMPIEYDTNPVKKYNKAICDELGITIPEGYEALGE